MTVHVQADVEDSPQQPDTVLGHYYVTMWRDGRHTFLLGPFTNNHAGALAKVEECRKMAERLDPRAAFDAFGTGRISIDFIGVPNGRLNEFISLEG